MVFGTESLRWVQSYTYLDVLINSNGDFMSSSENVCVRGWKASFKIKSAFKNIDIDHELKLKLLDVLAKPILCYNAEIWGVLNNVFNSKSINQFWERVQKLPFEKFQLKFCKSILGVHTRAHNGTVIGELGRLPLFMNIINFSLKYIIHMDQVKQDRPLFFQLLKRINYYVEVNHGKRD